LETQLEYAKFQKDVWQIATSFAWKTFRDPGIRRQFKVLSVLGRAALPEDNLKEVGFLFYISHYLITSYMTTCFPHI